MIDNKVGAFERHPRGIAEVIREWFTTKQDMLKEMSQRAKAIGRPEVKQAVILPARLDLMIITPISTLELILTGGLFPMNAAWGDFCV